MRSHFCSVWVIYFKSCRRSVNTHFIYYINIFAYRKRFETKIKLFSFTETRDSSKFIEIYQFIAHAYLHISLFCKRHILHCVRKFRICQNVLLLFEGQKKPKVFKVCFYFFHSCNYKKDRKIVCRSGSNYTLEGFNFERSIHAEQNKQCLFYWAKLLDIQKYKLFFCRDLL
jgi:hypothetical protein